jgi:hypothetical protein
MINSFTNDNDWLSNFYNCIFYIDKLKYTSVEHYYQSKKTTNMRDQEKIRLCGSPNLAKKLGSQVTLRNDWHNKKLMVMYKGVYEKFNQNELLQTKLLCTYPKQLIEGNNWDDYYWGFCKGRGENKLGKILMKIRNDWLDKMVPF